jgi:hypothetical protein
MEAFPPGSGKCLGLSRATVPVDNRAEHSLTLGCAALAGLGPGQHPGPQNTSPANSDRGYWPRCAPHPRSPPTPKKDPHVAPDRCMLEAVGTSTFSPLALNALPQTSIIQISNQTAGDTMIRHNKCDTAILLSVNPKRSLRVSIPQTGSTNIPEKKPADLRTGRHAFAEDFTREHSLPGLHSTSFEISGCF